MGASEIQWLLCGRTNAGTRDQVLFGVELSHGRMCDRMNRHPVALHFQLLSLESRYTIASRKLALMQEAEGLR